MSKKTATVASVQAASKPPLHAAVLVRAWTGPVTVRQVAATLNASGRFAVKPGTEHVYGDFFPAEDHSEHPVGEIIEAERVAREVLGFQIDVRRSS